MYITHRQQFSVVSTLIDHTDDVNMFQTQVEPQAESEWFYGKVLNILMSFLWSIRLKNKIMFTYNLQNIHKKGSNTYKYKFNMTY